MSQQRPRLIALGDLLLDVVIRTEAPIARGTDVPGTLAFRRGGSAANTAAAFVRVGGTAALVTSLGDDGWGRRLASSLRSDGVRVHVIRHDGRSGRLAALVDERGERSFVTQRAAADRLGPNDLQPRWFRTTDTLHVPAYSLFNEPIGSASLEAAAMTRSESSLVSADLSSAGPLLSYGIRRTRARISELAPDVLFANRDEVTAILGQSGRRAWPGLLGMAPLVVVKDGAWGCRVLWRTEDGQASRQVDVAARRLGVADTTGAGDAFAAGFLFSLLISGGRPMMHRDRTLRRAALAGHRAARDALRRGRPEVDPR